MKRLNPRSGPLRLLAAVLPVILLACGQPQSTTGAAAPVAVSVVELRTEPVALQRELPGRTRAYLVAEVRPQVGGIVSARLFTEGSYVKAGDPLYQLEDATYRAADKSARAAVARAEAALELARLNAERAEELREANGVISEQEYQTLVAVLHQAEADLEVARAELTMAAIRVDRARIKSPIAGRIGKSAVTQGALVTADQEDALAVVQQLDPIYVDVTQSASELLNLRRALSDAAIRLAETVPVKILFDDGTEYAQEGELAFSDATVDPMTGSVDMRIVVPNPELLLLPGMYVRAVVSNAIIQDGLLVPQRGITRDVKGRAIAMVVTAEDRVEARSVELDGTIGDRWLVRAGLAPGDRVIVEGLQKIAPGAAVEPTVVDAEAK